MRECHITQIIRNNYKKIFNHIFNPRRRDFINSLYDLLRHQKPPAFNFLRELFRIARIHYVKLPSFRCPKYTSTSQTGTLSTSSCATSGTC